MIDLKASSEYVKEAEKHERNAFKISFHTLLKEAATKKLRLRFWAHSLGEYLYILTKCGLTFTHRTYAINQTDDDLLERKIICKKKVFGTLGEKEGIKKEDIENEEEKNFQYNF